MKAILGWLEERTGAAKLTREVLCANIPGGARWRYVWGGTLLFAIGVQFVTGIFLWLDYSPSAQTAWESVNYIQNEMSGGWLLRGLHHYNAQLLPVLLVLHLMQVVIGGAYKSPREVNFWVGLVLLQLVLMTALTGYQLPWDQKGFWATKVAMNLMGVVPTFGPALQRILIGGADYGHLTLTRFFAVHAGILPGAIMLMLALHFYLFRRHGFAGDVSKHKTDGPFWPDQALRNAVACLALVATLMFLIVRHRLFSTSGPLGAELGAPADPSQPYSAARPEWYFLFMFQFLKLFPGGHEIWGAVVVPSLVALAIFLMPFTARLKRGHVFNVVFLCVLVLGAGALALVAKMSDAANPEYQAAVIQARAEAERVKTLAHLEGIPAGGALTLLQHDPLTQGPKLFARNCASCHRYNGTDGMGRPVKDTQSASDLAGFGSRAWLTGLLDPERISTTNYFGGTKLKDGKMVKFVQKEVAAYTPEQKEQLRQVIEGLSAEAHLKLQLADDGRDATRIKAGVGFLTDDLDCTKCHGFHEEAGTTAPDLTGYGSREWLVKFLNNPGHDDFYGDLNDRMPAFGAKGILSQEEIGMIADWLRHDWKE
ncbi:MAG TPA: cytochrome b N-terminal domain-containing protein [Verrucomicrobiae bacterium]|nr:cytochrome b N-terminal domain-containing protein [Verrucomicrobiae bacterium]